MNIKEKERYNMKVDHIGIAVKDLEKSLDFYKSLFSGAKYEHITYEAGGLDIVMIQAENVKVELLMPWDEDSAIGRYIEKHGEGLHHIAYEVPDIQKQMQAAKATGIRCMTEEAYYGAEGHLVFFTHPKDAFGTSHEFCQDH